MKERTAFDLIETELIGATNKFGEFPSMHHGYAAIKEELDELWDAIKDKEKGLYEIRGEAIQVGAMAVRFLTDLIDNSKCIRR